MMLIDIYSLNFNSRTITAVMTVTQTAIKKMPYNHFLLIFTNPPSTTTCITTQTIKQLNMIRNKILLAPCISLFELPKTTLDMPSVRSKFNIGAPQHAASAMP